MKTEWKRILAQPFFWIFLLACMLVNVWFLAANFAGQRKLVSESVKAQKEIGKTLDEKTLPRYIGRLGYLDADKEKGGGMPTIKQVLLAADQMADSLTAGDVASAAVSNLKLYGKAAAYVEKEFTKLESVVEENRADRTARDFFVPCTENFFSLFSSILPLACTLEGILASVFLTIRCVNEPFAAGNAEVLFSSKKGRRLCREKQAAGLFAGLFFGVLLWGMTLLAITVLFPLKELWDAKIGSMMMLEGMYPLISRIPMALKQYVAVQAGLSFALFALFSLLAGLAAVKTRNSLSAFAGLGVVCMAIHTAAVIFPGGSMAYFFLRYNPETLAETAGHYFVNGVLSFSPEGYEAVTLFLWYAVTAVLFLRQGARFQRADI